jgi:hypothetical protein
MVLTTTDHCPSIGPHCHSLTITPLFHCGYNVHTVITFPWLLLLLCKFSMLLWFLNFRSNIRISPNSCFGRIVIIDFMQLNYRPRISNSTTIACLSYQISPESVHWFSVLNMRADNRDFLHIHSFHTHCTKMVQSAEINLLGATL